jgi:hypothetical protein
MKLNYNKTEEALKALRSADIDLTKDTDTKGSKFEFLIAPTSKILQHVHPLAGAIFEIMVKPTEYVIEKIRNRHLTFLREAATVELNSLIVAEKIKKLFNDE